jgi:hypothetical protein
VGSGHDEGRDDLQIGHCTSDRTKGPASTSTPGRRLKQKHATRYYWTTWGPYCMVSSTVRRYRSNGCRFQPLSVCHCEKEQTGTGRVIVGGSMLWDYRGFFLIWLEKHHQWFACRRCFFASLLFHILIASFFSTVLVPVCRGQIQGSSQGVRPCKKTVLSLRVLVG